jgi:hypothetical protein
MTRLISLVVLWVSGLGLLVGCSGPYRFTAPDQIAPVGGQTPAVLRVQRQEVWFWYRPAREALVRMQVEQGPMRAAFADANGYAAAAVPVGDVTGVFYLQLAHTNLRGDEFEAYIPTHVWDPRARVTAVDVKALPTRHNEVEQALMARLAAGSYIVYFTTESIGDHAELHTKLERAGYPRGPIVQRQAGVMELLRERFPRLEAGVAKSGRITRFFEAAGLERLTLEQAADRNGGTPPTPAPTSESSPSPEPTPEP